ncbi:hypothetical protein Gotri_001601 [Gossypium trilobum]|uniref:Uncharacterized protein n=1 Tax=Gossypium trilobum TaxID=34281 RepID=A0A7J9FFM0_9ROSI|nr:hypothetical protein [Gossypium trilobum]
MFVLLSASCIPIHSLDFTYKTLTRSKKSFIEILNNEVGSYDRWAARGKDSMLPEVTLEDFRIGSQFWSLTRKHAKLVVGDESSHEPREGCDLGSHTLKEFAEGRLRGLTDNPE